MIVRSTHALLFLHTAHASSQVAAPHAKFALAMDALANLYLVKKGHTGTDRTELHVLDAAAVPAFSTFKMEIPTGLHEVS